MKNFCLGSIVTSVVLLIGSYVDLRFGLAEVSGDIPPSKLESSLMRMAVHASARWEKTPISPVP